MLGGEETTSEIADSICALEDGDVSIFIRFCSGTVSGVVVVVRRRTRRARRANMKEERRRSERRGKQRRSEEERNNDELAVIFRLYRDFEILRLGFCVGKMFFRTEL